MRFEPRIIDEQDHSWDDETCQLQLPDDLAELGDQLHADALYLAGVHPAWPESGRPDKPAGRADCDQGGFTRQRRMASGLLAATVAASALLLAVAFTIDPPSANAPQTQSRNSTETVGDRPVASSWFTLFAVSEPAARSRALGVTSPFPAPISEAPPETITAEDACLLQTGGPQAEAYLDYIEMTTVRNVKLSL